MTASRKVRLRSTPPETILSNHQFNRKTSVAHSPAGGVPFMGAQAAASPALVRGVMPALASLVQLAAGALRNLARASQRQTYRY